MLFKNCILQERFLAISAPDVILGRFSTAFVPPKVDEVAGVGVCVEIAERTMKRTLLAVNASHVVHQTRSWWEVDS